MGALFLFVISFVLFSYGMFSVVRLYSYKSWQPVDVDILSVNVVLTKESHVTAIAIYFYPDVKYKYAFNDLEYEGVCFALNKKDAWFSDEVEARQFINRILNKKIVYINPTDPAVSAFVTSTFRSWSSALAPIIAGFMISVVAFSIS